VRLRSQNPFVAANGPSETGGRPAVVADERALQGERLSVDELAGAVELSHESPACTAGGLDTYRVHPGQKPKSMVFQSGCPMAVE
jgi:hypothetical protein